MSAAPDSQSGLRDYSISIAEAVDITQTDSVSIIKARKVIKLPRIIPGYFYIKSHGDYLSIGDHTSNSVLIINESGDEICNLSKCGEDNGYLILSDFHVDIETHTITLSDGFKNKVLQYDYSGNLLSSMAFYGRLGSSTFWKTNNHYYFDRSFHFGEKRKKASLLQTDLDLKATKYFLPERRQLGITMAHRTAFYEVNDTLVYNKKYDPVYYNLVNESLTPRFRLNFGENAVRNDVIFQKYNHISDYEKLVENSGCIYYCNTYETIDHILVSFCCNNKGYLSIISRHSGKVAVYLISNNDFCESIFLPKGTYRDWFIFMNPNIKDELILCKFAFK